VGYCTYMNHMVFNALVFLAQRRVATDLVKDNSVWNRAL